MATESHRKALSESLKRGFAEGRSANKGKQGKKDSEETREKKRIAALNRKPHSQATKDKIGKAHKGKTVPREVVERQQASLRLSIKANGGGFATGPRSQEMRDKMSEIVKARPESEWRPKMEAAWEARRNQEITDDMREKYRQARLRTMRDKPESVGIKVWFDTKPELEFEEELKKRGIKFQKQFHSSNPHYLYDFLIDDSILIEIDGPWHYKASLHRSEELFKKMQMRDAAKNLAAVKLGFRIARIEVGQKLPPDWFEILIIQGINLDEI